jgi:fibronectin type 3 domain-containing protein
MITQFLKPRAARRKAIVWGLGFVALFGIATLSSSSMAAPNPTCSPTTNVTTKGLTTVTFNGAGTCDWTVPAGVTTINADVVAGGGSGAVGQFGGGGGGGGQLVMLRQIAVTPGDLKTVVVGAGGAAAVVPTPAISLDGNDGQDSSLVSGATTYVAKAGLKGLKNSAPLIAGNGGGSFAASTVTASGQPTAVAIAGGTGQTQTLACSTTTNARNGGGGAGTGAAGSAGAAAATSGVGGAGVSVGTLNGIAYGGGGGAHRENSTATTGGAAGGIGGGGAGGRGATTVASYIAPTSGTAGTGGGGGGYGGQCSVAAATSGMTSGAGGSGTVVIQYANPAVPVVVASGWQGYNQLDWDAYADTTTTGYKVYWSTSEAALTDANIGTLAAANIATISSAAITTYTHPNLALGTTYYYRVAAVYLNASNVATVSPLSSTVSATPQLTETVKFIQAGPNDTPRVTTSFDVKDFVVPAGVANIQVKAVGAGAGATNALWGSGGSVLANLPVTSGETLKVYVGSQPQTVNNVIIPGFNGGGTAPQMGLLGYGGGASDIRRGGNALANRIIVAGGGGGRSGGYWGGPGGGLAGGIDSGNQVAGGTQTGAGAQPAGTPQISGALGIGGSATNASGAGGGGYYGGNSNAGTYAGGGGSSYTDPSALNVVHAQGGNAGDGYVTITYAAQSLVPTSIRAVPGQAQNTIGWAKTPITGAAGYKVYGGTTVHPTTLLATINSVDTLAYMHTGLSNGTTYYYRITATVPANFQAAIAASPAVESDYSAEVSATPNFLATETFDVTRSVQPWTVPQGVTWIQVTAKGAAGGATTQYLGNGGIVSALVPVTPGEVLNLYVGSQPATINGTATAGYNGGGTSGGGIIGYGGGATDIRRGGTSLANRILVAGGGGGRSASYWGGAGGGLVGSNDNGNQTAGGTQTGPGAQIASTVQVFGGLGVGGSATNASGAGGGGYWGGNSNLATYAGGGGSSYATPTAINVIHTQATSTVAGVTGDGSITISYPTVAYPVGVQAIPAQGYNTIIWDQTNISGATGYKVYGGTTPNPTTLISTITGAGITSYKHTGLTIGTTYYYRVTVMSGTLESQKSAEASAIPTFTVDKTFNVTRGLQTFTVPSGVYWLYTTARGAAAGATTQYFGNGGIVSGIVPVTPGEVLNLYVGSQPTTINGVATVGYNGGGTSGYGIGGYGGGATDIRRGGTALANRILVAGGGGGRSPSYWGGPGGGLIGGADNGNQVAGGTQTGAGWQPAGTTQVFGTLGIGGSASNTSGAGGGGYWGGNANLATYAGGGGSSYADPAIANVAHIQASATVTGITGDGSITITYGLNQPPRNFAAVPATNKVSLSWSPSEVSALVDYQLFRGTIPNPTALLATVAAPTTVYVDSTAVNGTTYYYRLVARATVNAVSTATQSTSDVSAAPTASTTVSFSANGAEQSWQVPAGVSWIQVVAKGAAAGQVTGNLGNGGQVAASLPVTPGETLSVNVGTQPKTVGGVVKWGWNGGGTSGMGVTGGGGGATDIRRSGNALSNRVLVAGGGGGRSASYWGGPGGLTIAANDNGNQVAGGTQTGPGWQPAGTTQVFGTLGVGGSASNASGAGGGGYWGGNSNLATYGGGGGSSYASPDAVNVVHTQGGNIGDGTVIITYVLDSTAPTVTGVSSPAINSKTYKAGEDIYVDVNFSESVIVTGSPTLDLNTGLGGQRTIAYVSGSGTANLRFLYTVLPGDDKTNLDYWSTSALSIANGSTIDDAAGNHAVLTLPAVGSANSLASKLLVVDGIVPVAPVLVGASGATQITINWAAVPDADLAKYNVYVSTDGINFNQLNSLLATQASQVTTFTQQIVARGITYYYYITSVDVHGNESDPSITTSWSIALDGTIQTPSINAKTLTNNLRQPVTGVAVPGSTVEIFDGGVSLGTVIADAQTGVYGFTPGSDWSVGTHDITARASLNTVTSSSTVISKMMVDTVAPTFTSQLRSNPIGEKTASVVLIWKLTFSEAMTSLDTSDFAVTGTTAAVASVTQTFGTTTSYDVRVTGGNIGTVNGGITLAFKPGQTATDIAGNPLVSTTPGTTAQNYVLDHSYPVVTITSNRSTIGAAQTASISFDVSLDPVVGDFAVEDLNVIGGALSNFAVGSTPSSFTATFTPTVGYQGTATIDLPFGMFNSQSGLPNLKATQLAIAVDTVAPTVTNITASPTSGTYKAGAVVPISVTFSEAVTVAGPPTLKLETGATDQLATYASGSGTSTLIFNYTVVAGDTAADLNYFDASSLVLPSSPAASIKDAGLNAAVLTLPAVTAATVGNLATNAAIVIDTTAPSAPTALALTPVGGTVVANTLNSTNTNLTASATIVAASATGGKAELVVTAGGIITVDATDATILAGDTSVTFDLGATTSATLQAAIAAGGSVTVRLYDLAGNLSTASTAVTLTVDYAAPSISAFTGLATTVSAAQTVTISTSEATTTFATADIVSSCGGTGTLTGSGASYSYAWVPAANTTGSCTFTISAGSFTDAAGNPSVAFTKSTIIDNVAPIVTGVTAVSPNGTYIVGSSIDLAVNFSEPVTVVGNPTLAIKSTPAGSPAIATYVSGSGTNKLVFTYAVSVGDNSADLNYAATTSLTAGTSIKDAAGNNATLTLPAITAGTAGNLATNAAIVVDALAPTAPGSPTMTVVGGTLVAGFVNSTNTNITASISGLTAGDVTGGKAELLWTPTGGTATVVAADTSISLIDTVATFDFGSTTAAALQSMIAGGTGGTGAFAVRLTDVSGNVSSAGMATSNITVDYVKPTVAITSGASGTLKAAQTAAITFTASEATTNLASGDATANLGTLAAISATSATVYTANFTANADGVWSVTVAAGAFTDAAGNPNVAATPVTGNADVTAPTSVKVSALDALYKSGDAVDITVEFSEAVTVDVARSITLALTPSRTATYLSGNGTNKVIFRYTVQNGDQSLDLNYAAAGNWSGTGNVTDLAGNIASSFALPTSTSITASLAGSSNVKIDALAPTAANAPTLTVTPAVAANTLNAGSTNLTIATTWATADASLSQVEFLVAGNVVATQTIANPATATSATFNFGTTTSAGLQAALSAGGSVTVRLVDIAGNSATSTATNLTADFVAPTVTIGMPAGTIIAGQTRTITFTLSEAAANFAIGDVAVTNGTLGSFSGSGTSYSAVFTPTSSFTGATVVSIAAGVFTDAAANPSFAATSVSRAIDTAAPTVTLNRTAATSTINTVTYTVTGNEAIDCSTLSASLGVDFDVTNGVVTAIDQTDALTCTVTVAANATRGSPATVVIAKSSSFSVSDANGNAQTALTIANVGANATITVTIPTVAPSEPSNLAGTPAATKALLTWNAPVDIGGAAVTSYVIQKTTVANPITSDWVTVAAGDLTFAGNSATVSNLTNGTDYYFRVLAVNISGSSPYSTASAAINPYDVPAAPAIALTAGSNQLNLTITPGANGGRAITAYQWTIDGGLTWTAFSTTSLSQSITGLANGNAYSVKVRALNVAGAGSASSIATATPAGLASAPPITGVTGGNASVVVSFTAPVDNGGAAITNYEFSTNNGVSFTALATPSTVSPMTITGLTNGSTYAIKIRAVTSIGAGAASSATNGYPLTAPSTPTALTATPGLSSIAVSFTPGATGGATPTYTATATPVGGGSAISAIGSGSPVNIAGLSNGVSYTISLVATNAAGSSAAVTSGSTSFMPSGVPSVPQITAITPGANTLTVNFTSVSVGVSMDAWDYKVRLNNNVSCQVADYVPVPWLAFDSITWVSADTGTDTTGSLTASGLTNGSCYDFIIRTHNANGYSVISRASGMPVTDPWTPSIYAVTRGDGQLTVSFNEPADNGGVPFADFEYQVNGGSWVSAGMTSPFTISGLTNGTSYGIKMRAKTVDSTSVARYSAVSITESGTPAAAPAQVVYNGAQIVGDGFIDFPISSVPGNGGSAITSYQVSSSSDGITWSTWTNATWTSGLTVRVAGLTNSTSGGLYYKLRAVNAIGAGAASASTGTALTSGTVPATPTITAVAHDSSATLTYVAGASGGFTPVTIQYSTDGGATWLTATANPMIITGLTNGTTYNLRVRATNAAGSSVAATASVTPAGAASAPTITSISSGQGVATINFTGPVNTGGGNVSIDSYDVSITGGLTWTRATLASGTVSAGTISLTGLTNGATYPVKIRANNSFGAGAVSNAVNALPAATVPGAPAISVSAGRNLITVTFFAPLDDGGAMINTYQYSLNGVTWVTSSWRTTSPSNSFDIIGLANGTSYSVQLRAVNSAGSSAASNTAAATPSGATAALAIITGYTGASGQASPI